MTRNTPRTAPRVVGRVGRPHGLGGEVAVDVRTDVPEERFAPGAVLVTAGGHPLTVVSARPHAGRLLVVFEGVADRTAARALRGALLTVDVAELAAPKDPDEFHDYQLEGLAAVDTDGSPLGSVREVVHVPGSDLLLLDTGRGERLVPFVRAIVPQIDLAAGRVVLDPPEGLLD